MIRSMEALKENLKKIHERIETACYRSGRKSSDIKLLLATKTVSAERILEALKLGETLIGENRAQELVEKYDALKLVKHRSHFIGNLQSNKINSIIDKVDCIESIDNFRLAERLNRRLAVKGLSMDVFLEVNTSGEDTKIACKPDELFDLAEKVSLLPCLKVRGLMTIGALTDNEKSIRACFELLRNLSEKLKAEKSPNIFMEELSMGMSGDFELAIEEGSTEIRLGSAVFGARK